MTIDENEPFTRPAVQPGQAAAPVALPTGMQADFDEWQKRGQARRLASAQPAVTVRAPDEPDPFAEFRRKPTAEEIAEDERRIAALKAEKDADARALARKEWEEAVPEMLRQTNWQDPRLVPYQRQIQAVRGWKRGSRGIYALGRSGRGKSRSIYELARRLAVDELVPVCYLLQTEITREINRDGLNSFLAKIDGIKRAPVIVWDDFGKFTAIGSRKDLLFSEIEALIDYRHSHGLPFLISSNATDSALMELFGPLRGEPIIRRIVEGSQVVDFGWDAAR